ncbi:DUF1349 domain-containing protein [Bifidobacterium mongoliense]|uniref:DUF1349 domain-containing protein n=1 Tax=Bifidobacterium mongoliense TaxID=518643 RepID=UPI0030EC7568
MSYIELILYVIAHKSSDARRITSHGFIHDSENALIVPFEPSHAMEATFQADMSEQFGQAGLFIRADEKHWVKTGLLRTEILHHQQDDDAWVLHISQFV